MSKLENVKSTPLLLDAIDWKILEELNANPRIKLIELATKLNIHRNTLSSKFAKIQDLNLLKTITKPNYEKLNYTTAYIFATAAQSVNNKDTGEKISQLAGVEEVNVISGEWDFIIKIRALSIEQIGSTIIEQLKNYCDKTVTAFSFWSFEGSFPYSLIRENK